MDRRIYQVTGLIQEFYSRELGYLKQTLSLSEETKNQEAARLAAHKFKEYSDRHEIPPEAARAIAKAEVKSRLNDEPLEQWERVELVAEKWPQVVDDFGAWVRKNGLWNSVGAEGYPTWDLYDGCQLLRPQWLVSFVESPWSVAKSGFTFGFEEDHIGYGVVHHSHGYWIAYTPRDLKRALREGKKAVIFKAPGIRTHHTGAEMYQVLFWGPDAKDIVPTHVENGLWCVQDWASDRTIFKSDDLAEVAAWVGDNFVQYSKSIRPR